MSIDPHFEDYQRLSVRFARDLDPRRPLRCRARRGGFRSSLSLQQGTHFRKRTQTAPSTSWSRRVTSLTTSCPSPRMIPPRRKTILEARKCLNEALDLDPSCHDARRMLAAASSGSPTADHRYLADNAASVREACERNAASYELPEGDLKDVATLLAFRPYLRWIAIEASNALVCGRYRLGTYSWPTRRSSSTRATLLACASRSPSHTQSSRTKRRSRRFAPMPARPPATAPARCRLVFPRAHGPRLQAGGP